MKDIKDRIIEKQDELILHRICQCQRCKQLLSEVSALKSQLQDHVTTKDCQDDDKAREER